MKDTITITRKEFMDTLFDVAEELAEDCAETTKSTMAGASLLMSSGLLGMKVANKLFGEDEE